MAPRKCCSRFRKYWPRILKCIAIKVCVLHAIFAVIQLHKDYKQNSVITVVQLHQNETIRLPDAAVCVPLSFMTNDQKLVRVAKQSLLHDPSFFVRSMRLENSTAVEKYWARKNAGKGTVTASDLIGGLINDTLKPFLKHNMTFPEESPMDRFLAEEAEIFDIIETSSGVLVNKTVLLASVALLDVITGYGDGRESANSLTSKAAGLNDQEVATLTTMAKELLNKPSIADQFSSNVAETMCDIFAPVWNYGSTDICGPNGTVANNPYYISLNQFCFDIPVSSSSFTKASPTSTLSLSIPLSKTVFSLGPLPQILNGTSVNLTNQTGEPKASPLPPNPFIFAINFTAEANNTGLVEEQPDMLAAMKRAGGSMLDFKLPFDPSGAKTPNISARLAKIQHQMQELLHNDLASLAFKFPIITPRVITIYSPNIMRYDDSEMPAAAAGLFALLTPTATESSTSADDVNFKVLEYVIQPTGSDMPVADTLFGVISKSRKSTKDNPRCSDAASTPDCLKRCTVASIQTACGCVPFGTQRLTNLDVTRVRFCQLEDQTCINLLKVNDGNSTSTATDCESECIDDCAVTKYRWREPKPKLPPLSLGSSFDAMISSQPTHWTWSLTCDSFDYVEYVDKQLITRHQYLAQVGGIFGLYGTIFCIFLLILHIIKTLANCIRRKTRKTKDSYDMNPENEKPSGYYDRKQPTYLDHSVIKAIEEAVRAEIQKARPLDEPLKRGISEKEVPKDTFISRLAIGAHTD